jgi:hypothetical protein
MFERRIEFTPAYDKRHPNPKKNFGIHGVGLRFVLIGPDGATQFLVYTNWHLEHVRQEQKAENIFNAPIPADVGYHSRKPMFAGHTPMPGVCDILGVPCYYDGSGLVAENLFDEFCERGTPAVWEHLEKKYYDMFGAKPTVFEISTGL